MQVFPYFNFSLHRLLFGFDQGFCVTSVDPPLDAAGMTKTSLDLLLKEYDVRLRPDFGGSLY